VFVAETPAALQHDILPITFLLHGTDIPLIVRFPILRSSNWEVIFFSLKEPGGLLNINPNTPYLDKDEWFALDCIPSDYIRRGPAI
jgi:hypothetical protein